MKYEKPELIEMGPAVECVQGPEKPHAGVFDNVYGPDITADAYEADE